MEKDHGFTESDWWNSLRFNWVEKGNFYSGIAEWATQRGCSEEYFWQNENDENSHTHYCKTVGFAG